MLKKLVVGPYQTNCYVLGCDQSSEGAVIDPGDEVFRIIKVISESGLTIKYILITHGHVDHVGGAQELRRITGAPVYIHPLDRGGLGFPPDGELYEGQEFLVGRYPISVIHTPGHSPG
ncbi:MAG: MBL fold metallo-hydrolase, partial [Deltaproteobacteria bacterium]|nr:MBL fold metallo-hydrolase [Deltaproteobacteria bacterium]